MVECAICGEENKSLAYLRSQFSKNTKESDHAGKGFLHSRSSIEGVFERVKGDYMSQSLFRWKNSQATEFLSVVDAFIALELYKEIRSEKSQICEIGVWRGGWIQSLCANQVMDNIIGIDPYPGLPDIKREFEENVMSLYPNVELYPSLEIFSQDKPGEIFSMVHIDGEHSEIALLNDLEDSAKILDREGILIIDDIWHESFPGIASAAFKFIHHSDFSPFLISGAKMYLCKESQHKRFFETTERILTEGNLTYQTSFKKGTYGEDYQQENCIKGYQQIITNGGRKNVENLTALSDAAPSKSQRFFNLATKLFRQLVPPLFPRVIQYFFKRN